ncbi:MAG: aminopeptidase [Lachnospiraceae bacterium]|nr:aminopeptidase [Lachnospiraceae bacterium]
MVISEELRSANKLIEERYQLAAGRLKELSDEIVNEGVLSEGLSEYFLAMVSFSKVVLETHTLIESGAFYKLPLDLLQMNNTLLYADILPEHYESSFANPRYAKKRLGEELGNLLSYLYMELRGMIIYAFEQRKEDLTVMLELLLEVYGLVRGAFETEESGDLKGLTKENSVVLAKEVKDTLYWFASDYADHFVARRIREQIDPTLDFANQIIQGEDLDDVRYLYFFGEYIGENELGLARFLSSLPEDEISAMASTFVEGYRKGFEVMNKPLHKKKTVNIRYHLGLEKMIRKAMEGFQNLGLSSTIYRAATERVNKRMHIRNGYYGAIANLQMDYDHRFDQAIFLDKAYMTRILEVTKATYDTYEQEARVFGGPAVVETFGEDPLEPESKPEALSLSKKQKELSVALTNELGELTSKYILGEERSFTIIAFPVPEIGKDFEAIFHETVKINTLDYELYKEIQTKLINELSPAEYVEVVGAGENRTNIRVSIMPMTDPTTQATFENCVADVNIPLGEVFTSPQLKNTTGIIHVSQVYLNDICFNNFTMEFKDGMIVDYSCDNFALEKDNKDLIHQTVLFDHDTLPMGEFAIGTNTTAYRMANRYQILYKLPILIVEKTGPHFAVGDTCYSRSEDVAVYNPDGKEIIARDNEVSLLRKEDPSKAYFNCHTDVTIPYREIGGITAVWRDGSRHEIMKDGRFVVEGCEELNKALDE